MTSRLFILIRAGPGSGLSREKPSRFLYKFDLFFFERSNIVLCVVLVFAHPVRGSRVSAGSIEWRQVEPVTAAQAGAGAVELVERPAERWPGQVNECSV